MSFTFDGISLQNKRVVNMDSLMIKKRNISDHNYVLAVVCDGVGSLEDGAYAAARSVRYTREWFESLNDTKRLGLRFKENIAVLDNRIYEESLSLNFRTASTFSSVLLEEKNNGVQYYIVHTGDSRIYLYQSGVLEQLTTDQAYEGKLLSYIGRPGGATLFYDEGCVQEGKFLLCSDGLYKKMDLNYLFHELRTARPVSVRKSIDRLTNHVVLRGEKDNISVAIVMCEVD